MGITKLFTDGSNDAFSVSEMQELGGGGWGIKTNRNKYLVYT